MVVTSPREVVRGLLLDAGFADSPHARSPDELKAMAALISAVFGRLIARRFAAPDDFRITLFAERVMFRAPAALASVPVVSTEALIRMALGDRSWVDHIPVGRVIGMQIFLSRELLYEDGATASGLHELIASTERLVRVSKSAEQVS